MSAAVHAREEQLHSAIDSVSGHDLLLSLAAVARAMPVPLGLELVAIRLRATDATRGFHLVAMEGVSPRDTARHALEPYSLAMVRSLFLLGPAHSVARGLGMRWFSGRWLLAGDNPIGALSTGSRTERHPTPDQAELLVTVADRLGKALRRVDRSSETLEQLSAQLARETLSDQTMPPTPALEPLRPRERDILALYTEGMSADDIGRMLFISPHTVRTHVKNAFRRLGIHSREEAAVLVHTDEVARVI